jgi:uncharacterized membrane protein YeaQ/YmgE (transglycosylase-associated protein family)
MEEPVMDVVAIQYLASPPIFESVSWFAYIIIGGIAGWLAGKIVKGGGQGVLLNIVVGVIGGFLGGFILSKLGFDVASGRKWFTFFTALLGAVVLLWIVGLVRRGAKK